ncbi:aldo/keto reductase [Chitinilyticum piscinae]|uniref:Protein tas n=1 Tax=Chitinilyticum piscinae TaxID=2866724 RepID=A0A8J7FK80_9NEIS|nr:aldo/keto reductase [Chitinilyticum piscinae]MBE9610990.1 aldo/keto reductase [Chitinilyticum piscinae]
MDYRTLPGTDLAVSTLCLGTMTFGEQNSEAEAHAQLDLARDSGINLIDTAEMYPVPARAGTQGATERIVGSWLQHQSREEIILATKVAGPNRGMDWIRGGPQLNREQIIAACDASLLRLKTDYIDLYQLHWPARHVPMFGQTYYDPANEYEHGPALAESLAALGELVQAGKVRHIGVSNETPWGVMECKRLAREQGLPVISTIQNVYNLINRGFEHGLNEVCHRENVGLLVYSPLAFGLLSGKYVSNPQADGRMTRFANFGVRYLKPHVNEAVAAYAALAQEYDLTPAQLALGWVQSRWFVCSTILGATTLEQLQENLSVGDVTLSDELLAAIEAIHRRCPSPAL